MSRSLLALLAVGALWALTPAHATPFPGIGETDLQRDDLHGPVRTVHTEWRRDGQPSRFVYDATYDPHGYCTRRISYAYSTDDAATPRREDTVTYTVRYDAQERMVESIGKANGGSDGLLHVTRSYDARGYLLEERQSGIDTAFGGRTRVARYAYDAQGRPIVMALRYYDGGPDRVMPMSPPDLLTSWPPALGGLVSYGGDWLFASLGPNRNERITHITYHPGLVMLTSGTLTQQTIETRNLVTREVRTETRDWRGQVLDARVKRYNAQGDTIHYQSDWRPRPTVTEYVYDARGNWTQQTTCVPAEDATRRRMTTVVNRTITYYED